MNDVVLYISLTGMIKRRYAFIFWMGKQSCESDSELLVDVYSLAIYVYFCKGEILSLLTFGV